MRLNLKATIFFCAIITMTGVAGAEEIHTETQRPKVGVSEAKDKPTNIKEFFCILRDVVKGAHLFGGGRSIEVNTDSGEAKVFSQGAYPGAEKTLVATLKTTEKYSNGKPNLEHFEGEGYVFDISKATNSSPELGLIFRLGDDGVKDPYICPESSFR